MTRDADNPYDMAEAIRNQLLVMPYTLNIALAPPGQDWVEFFLLVQRRGYCQNYASAMITMLRSLGVPARLVVGFAPGDRNVDRGVWEVKSRHYHAWPEVYFPGHGWFEFEPTPADVQPALENLGFQPQGGLLSATPAEGECFEELFGEECLEPASEDGIDGLIGELPDQEGDVPGGDNVAGGGRGFLTSPWALLGLGLALALALMAPVGAASYARWGILQLGYPTVTYAIMCFLGRLGGVGLRPQDTPWEYGARLGVALPGHREAVANITQGFVTVRYGPFKGLSTDEMEKVRASWREVRGPLLGRILRRPLPRRS